jgi:light-regulated signal transduction histidine kinase (bacteriophytochrome)
LSLPIDGEVRSFRTHLKPTFDPNGNVTRLIGTSEDISAEEELKTLRLRTQTVSKELEEFMYMAAHDLRGPMRSVHILADFLREDFSDLGDGKLDLIDKLENISVQANSMLDEVLEHAEITGTQESMETFNLSELCNDILSCWILMNCVSAA